MATSPASAGEKNERSDVAAGTERLEELDAVHRRHLVVADDSIIIAVHHPTDGLIDGCGRVHGELDAVLDEVLGELKQQGLVVDVDGPNHGKAPRNGRVRLYLNLLWP
jgi:hypothetical protein